MKAFFAKLTTGSVALNNASYTSGNTIANKIQNMTDQQYQGHSTYKYSKEVFASDILNNPDD